MFKSPSSFQEVLKGFCEVPLVARIKGYVWRNPFILDLMRLTPQGRPSGFHRLSIEREGDLEVLCIFCEPRIWHMVMVACDYWTTPEKESSKSNDLSSVTY